MQPGTRHACSAAPACRRWPTSRSPVDLVLLGVPDKAAGRPGPAGRRPAATPGRWSSAPRTGCATSWSPPPTGWSCAAAAAWASSTSPAGVRAIGYLERDPLPAGPIALVTHSGSVFSAMLRTHRRLEYSARRSRPARSSSPPRPTTSATRCRCRRPASSAWCWRRCGTCRRCAPRSPDAAERDVPVVALTVGRSAERAERWSTRTRARSPARTPAWEALFAAYGVHRVRRPRRARRQPGDASRSVAGSAAARAAGSRPCTTPGAERVLVADVAERLGVPFAPLSAATTARLAALLDPGLEPTNPLDVWGTGAEHGGPVRRLPRRRWPTTTPSTWSRWRSTWCRSTTATTSFPRALEPAGRAHRQAGRRAGQPLHRRSTSRWPADLRARGIPVLEGTRSGLRALGHLLAHADRPVVAAALSSTRSGGARWARAAASRRRRCAGAPRRLRHPRWPRRSRPTTRTSAVAAAERLGYPVVLKTACPEVRHKVDVGRRPPRPRRRRRGPRRVRRPRGPARPGGPGPAPGARPASSSRSGVLSRPATSARSCSSPRAAPWSSCSASARSPCRRSTATTARRMLVGALQVSRLLAGHRGGRGRGPRRAGRAVRGGLPARARARRPARGARRQPAGRAARRRGRRSTRSSYPSSWRRLERALGERQRDRVGRQPAAALLVEPVQARGRRRRRRRWRRSARGRRRPWRRRGPTSSRARRPRRRPCPATGPSGVSSGPRIGRWSGVKSMVAAQALRRPRSAVAGSSAAIRGRTFS